MKSVPVWISVMMIVVSIPMAMKKVPPNWIYGFRTPKTMSSPEIWYASNQKAGINMIVAGAMALAIWGVMRAFAGGRTASLAGLPVVMVLLFASVIVSLVQLRKM